MLGKLSVTKPNASPKNVYILIQEVKSWAQWCTPFHHSAFESKVGRLKKW